MVKPVVGLNALRAACTSSTSAAMIMQLASRAGGRLSRGCRQAFSSGASRGRGLKTVVLATSTPDVKELAKLAQIGVSDAEVR